MLRVHSGRVQAAIASPFRPAVRKSYMVYATGQSADSSVTSLSSRHPIDEVSPVPSRILVVDDEEDIAKLFQKALERAGFIVDTYNDPLQSLSNYRAGMYDLLLLDIKMPEMNGFELYKKIRQIDDKTKVCNNRIYPDR